MKKNQIRKSVAALAMAAVVSVSLLGYGCGSKSASSTAGVSGEFTGTAKGMGGDVTVTLTLTDGKITGCTAEGKDETPGIGTMALEQLPGAIAESGSIAVDGVATATITSDAIKEAAAAALVAAGLNADDYKTEVKAEENKAEDSTIDADIAIVGAGGAGMTAAITAAAEGKSVVILESQPMVGGNSVRATGGMNAGKTVYQDENEFGESAGVEKTLKTAAEKYADNATITALAKTVSEQWAAYQADPKGYFDSVELMELDTMIGGKGINDPALVETLCSNSADAIDWLDEHGITLHSVSSFGGASVKRIHRPVDGDGKTVSVGSYMIPLLQENCDKAGVQTLLNTTATEILTDANGAAVGVKATGASGENMRLVQAGDVDFAMVQNDVADSAFNGLAPFRSKLDNVRVIGRLYPEYLHVVASKDSGVKALEDFKGKVRKHTGYNAQCQTKIENPLQPELLLQPVKVFFILIAVLLEHMHIIPHGIKICRDSKHDRYQHTYDHFRYASIIPRNCAGFSRKEK